MKKILAITLLISSLFGLEIPKNRVVSTQWLEKNIDNKNLVIIDTRSEKEYKTSHLKGAVNYPRSMWFQGKIGNVPKTFNTPEQFSKMFSDAGVSEESSVVFYSAGSKNKDFADAASGLWTAWIYGFQNSAILNGGFSKWSSEKRSVTKEIEVREASDYEVESFDSSSLATLSNIMKAQYSDDVQIADTRVGKFYRGEDDRKDLARHGRIPTAKLTPMIRQSKKVGEHFEFLSKEQASKILNNSGFGLELDKEAIFYCNTGHKARGLWFVSKFIIGMKNVKVYENSFIEYAQTDLIVEDGEAMD